MQLGLWLGAEVGHDARCRPSGVVQCAQPLRQLRALAGRHPAGLARLKAGLQGQVQAGGVGQKAVFEQAVQCLAQAGGVDSGQGELVPRGGQHWQHQHHIVVARKQGRGIGAMGQGCLTIAALYPVPFGGVLRAARCACRCCGTRRVGCAGRAGGGCCFSKGLSAQNGLHHQHGRAPVAHTARDGGCGRWLGDGRSLTGVVWSRAGGGRWPMCGRCKACAGAAFIVGMRLRRVDARVFGLARWWRWQRCVRARGF